MTAIRATTSWTAALAGAAGCGIGAGGLTAYLQGVVPAGWSTIANSGAVWTVVAVAVAAAVGRTQSIAVAAGLLALLGQVVGYYAYLAEVHLPVSHAEFLLWTVAALWIGPLTGLGGFAVRWGPPEHRLWALLPLAGVIAGEGGYLIRFAGRPTSGWVEIVVASALAGGALASGRVPARGRAGALGAGVLTAGAVYLAYQSWLLG